MLSLTDQVGCLPRALLLTMPRDISIKSCGSHKAIEDSAASMTDESEETEGGCPLPGTVV